MVAVTNATGTLTSQQRYLPFGGERTDIGVISQTDYGYTGQRQLDDEIGLMDYKFRFYSPMLGRFISPDNITPDMTQGLNRYSYVVNNPVRFNDPSGHCATDDDDNGCGPNGGSSNNSGSGGCNCGLGIKHSKPPVFIPPPKEPNICEGKIPYKPQYTCGYNLTDPSYPYNTPPNDIVVGSDTYTEFSWPGKVNGTANNGAELVTIAGTIAVFDTNLLNHAFGNYVQGIIPYVQSNSSGQTAIGVVLVYNHTGSGVQVTGVAIDNQYQQFRSAAVIPKNGFGIVEINPRLVSGKTSVSVDYLLVINQNGSQATSIGIGNVYFHGQIGP